MDDKRNSPARVRTPRILDSHMSGPEVLVANSVPKPVDVAGEAVSSTVSDGCLALVQLQPQTLRTLGSECAS